MMLIHIGYPKTASTFLQNILFRNTNVGFLMLPASEALEQFVFCNSFTFSVKTASRAFQPILNEATEKDLIPVLSQEILACDQTQGMYWGKNVADRIQSVFPKAKILVLIREQKSMVFSSYAQYLKVGGKSTIQKFITRHRGFEAICRLDYLCYDQLIAYYQEIFGFKNVLVLPFELLQRNPKTVISRILCFAGIKEVPEFTVRRYNVRCGAATFAIQRRLNFFFAPWTYFDSPIPPLSWRVGQVISRVINKLLPQRIHCFVEEYLKQIAHDQIGDYFQKSNQRTSELIGIDLASFGYDR